MSDLQDAQWAELSRLGLATNAPDGDWRMNMAEIRSIADAARRVANGKRQWFCDAAKDLWDEPGCESIHPELDHDNCRWVLVTEDTDGD